MNGPATAAPVITPEDLLRMPDQGKGYELVDGKLKELNVSVESSYVGGRVFRRIDTFCEDRHPGWVFPADTSFQCFPSDPKRVRRSDVAFVALDRLSPEQYRAEGHCAVCPDLVVEVISPNDLASEVNRKVQEWLAAGAKLVWVIDPDAKLVFCHRPDGVDIRREADTLTGEPVLAGFACPVADLFRLPGAAAAG
jgi:Uma2 family endonuclease